jgi:hypothetical protein
MMEGSCGVSSAADEPAGAQTRRSLEQQQQDRVGH